MDQVQGDHGLLGGDYLPGLSDLVADDLDLQGPTALPGDE